MGRKIKIAVEGQPGRFRLVEDDGTHTAVVDPVPVKAAKKVSALPCIHLGEYTGESLLCPSCTGKVSVNLRGCAVHGKCTEVKRVKEESGNPVAYCNGCNDRRTVANAPVLAAPVRSAEYEFSGMPIGKRHLVYHLMPLENNGMWQWNVHQLVQRWPLFTGRKIVAVMTGGTGRMPLASIESVRRELPTDCEMIPLPNVPSLREVVSWVPLWERILQAAAPEDAILYAHAKAVTRSDPLCHEWAELLYHLSLDHPETVESLLQQFPIVGSLRRVGNRFGIPESQWHYSGSFFWARAGDMEKRPWRGINQVWYGNEAWPGTAYKLEESGCLFLSEPKPIPDLDLYKPETWALLRPLVAAWEAASRAASTPFAGS